MLRSALTALCLIAAPSLILADEIDEAAEDGSAFAVETFPDATVDADGNVRIGNGTNQTEDLTADELFPEANAETTSTFTDIDTEEEAAAAGEQARQNGSDAIDVVDETNEQEREDFSQDPFLDETDTVLSEIDGVADEFGACKTTRQAIPVTNTALIPELRVCERIQKVEGGCTLTHDISVDAASGTVLTDTWTPEDCLVAASHAIGPSVCTGTATLTAGAALGDCLTVNGTTICPGDPLFEALAPPPFDGKEQVISRLAQSVEIGPLDCETNLTVLPCATTSTGEQICPVDEGQVIDTCGGLRTDPVCRFIDQACVPGSEVNGICHLEEARFECDQEISFKTFQQQTTLSCPDSDIRCNGNECIEIDSDINNGITAGLAALTASQLLAFDSTCESETDFSTCTAYPGTPRACQRGIGGIFDSCELPRPVGPGPYLDLAFSIGALDSNLTLLSPTSPLRGAWEKLREPANSAIDTLQTPFVSASNVVTARTTANQSDAIANEDLRQARQDLLNGTADYVFDAFGSGAVNELFFGQGTDGLAADTTGRLGDVELEDALLTPEETPLSLVANAYSVSAIETIPAEPEPLVDGDDIAAAAHDDARNCLFVGTVCTADSFGACISRDRVECCFNSPLARLAQEAAVPQFSRDFGTYDLPNCRGLSGDEIQTFDWLALDLNQWIAILGTAERFPDEEKLTPDGLTGTGNILDVATPNETRPDAIARNRERLEGVDPAEVRERGRDELRSTNE